MNERKMDVFWRPPYELFSAFGWLLGATVTGLYAYYGDFGFRFLFLATLPMLLFSFIRFVHANKLLSLKARFETLPDVGVDLDWLVQQHKKNKGKVYIGHGFNWTQDHTQKIKDYTSRDESLFKVPLWYMSLRRMFGLTATIPESHPPVAHAVGIERPLYLPIDSLYQHAATLGASGTGKGLNLKHQIIQAILEGRTSNFIIDPKLDENLIDAAHAACKIMDKEHLFFFFAPQYPNSSVRIDLLASYSNLSQLATRLVSTLPPSPGDEAFRNFSWRALLAVCTALTLMNERITIVKIRAWIAKDFSHLVKAACFSYFEAINANKKKFDQIRSIPDFRECADECVNFYHQELAEDYSSRELENLFGFYSTDQKFMQKLIQNIVPILEQLCAPPLDRLLSPEMDDDPRPIVSLQTITRTQATLYMCTSSLSDSQTATAIATLMLGTTVSTVADRYNYVEDSGKSSPMNVFIDEASYVMSHSVLSMMSTSRGAYTHMNLSFQTLPDLEVRLGSKAAGEVAMGNTYRKTCFRVADEVTQTYMSSQFGMTTTKSLDYGFTTQTATMKDELDFNTSYSKQVKHTESQLVPPEALLSLPVGHAFVIADEVYKVRMPFINIPEDLVFKRKVYESSGDINLPSIDFIATNPVGVLEFTKEN